MKSIHLIVFCFIALGNSFGQFVSHIQEPDTSISIITDMEDPRVKFASTITAEDIKAHLSVLASDEFEGRETGEPGNEMAAQYLAKQFAEIGLEKTNGSYFQNVVFSSTGWTDTEIYVRGQKFKHLWDYLAYPMAFNDMKTFSTDEVMFAGYGIDDLRYSDYKGKSVDGKVVMVYLGEPMMNETTSRLTGTTEMSEWNNNIDKKLEVAKAKGAKMVLLVSPDLKGFLMENRKYMLGGRLELGDRREEMGNIPAHLYISTTMAEAIMGGKKGKVTKAVRKITKKGKSKVVALSTDFNGQFDNYLNLLEGKNVLGFIEGSDLKEELIVVSAHYDHLGKRGNDIFNGADDNGSGTSTVLDIAQAFQLAKDAGNGPRRSMLFLMVTGEEKGLLGSQWYAENPTFPIQNIVADVNVDMIGRIDDEHTDANYIYVIGSDRLSTDLHKINEQANNNYTQMVLDYTYNSEEDPNRYYYRSDHYNFAVKGIPAIFFFSGVHKDYHRPSDTIDKILFDKVEKTGCLIFHTTWDLVNRDKRIEVDGEKP